MEGENVFYSIWKQEMVDFFKIRIDLTHTKQTTILTLTVLLISVPVYLFQCLKSTKTPF